MQLTTAFNRLARTDLKLISRDSFLLLMFSFLIIISLVIRFALPALDGAFAVHWRYAWP